jgi:cyclopropane-fatty-acyl-phospholipid synthase
MHWFRNFQENWRCLRHGYDERFFRMWKYYLLSSAGAFRARANQVWQIVLSPRGVPGGYRIARDWRVDVSQGIGSDRSDVALMNSPH